MSLVKGLWIYLSLGVVVVVATIRQVRLERVFGNLSSGAREQQVEVHENQCRKSHYHAARR